MRDVYDSFAAMTARHREGVDYDRTVRLREAARIAILAPHGGRLENHTDEIAQAVAGEEFSLYCFRSRLGWGGTNLHITSHRFDDPDCLALVGRHPWAVALHGCSAPGERLYLGGRDDELAADLADALARAGLPVQTTDHPYPGRHPDNVCNRTARGAGVQLEMTLAFRRSGAVALLVATLRERLLARQAVATAREAA